MRRLSLLVLVAACTLAGAAPAQAQQEEMCDTFQGFIDQGKGQPSPFSDLAQQGQDMKDAGCSGGAPPIGPPEGGGDNPLCGPFRSLLDQGHAAGPPFSDLAAQGEAVYAGACAAGTTPTTQPGGDDDDDDTEEGGDNNGGGDDDDTAADVAEVLGETATNSDAGGSSLPRTGGAAAFPAFALTGAGAALAALRRKLRP